MAQKIQTLLYDDIDGSAADETLRFAFQGTEYEIDLSKVNADKMRKAIKPYAEKARTLKVTRPPRARSRGAAGYADSAAMRTWLMENGYGHELKDRGRIPARLVQKFEKREAAASPLLPVG